MAGRTDFTEEEWNDLQQGVVGAGLLVSSAHRDFTDSFGEAKAVASQMAAQRNSESELVRELAGGRGTGFGLMASPKEVEEAMASLSSSVALLQEKAPDEVEAYRQLVLDIATAAGEAKGGLKDEENAALERIRQALGVGGAA
jgi:hypothetical protein